MGYGGFEMGFFWYAGYEFQKVGEKSGMRDWAPPHLYPFGGSINLLENCKMVGTGIIQKIELRTNSTFSRF